MHHIQFTRSSVSGHVDCSQVLAVVNSIAITLECMCLLKLWSPPDIFPGVDLLDQVVSLFLAF